MAEEYPIFEIDLPLLRDVVNYLTTKPYVEVFQLIQRVQKLNQIGGPKTNVPDFVKSPPKGGEPSEQV